MIADPARGARRLECAAGDALLIDSRVLHCGGANASALRRRLLYLTLKVPYSSEWSTLFECRSILPT